MMQNTLNILAVLYDASFEKSEISFSSKISHAFGAWSVVQPIFHPIPNIQNPNTQFLMGKLIPLCWKKGLKWKFSYFHSYSLIPNFHCTLEPSLLPLGIPYFPSTVCILTQTLIIKKVWREKLRAKIEFPCYFSPFNIFW